MKKLGFLFSFSLLLSISAFAIEYKCDQLVADQDLNKRIAKECVKADGTPMTGTELETCTKKIKDGGNQAQ